MPWKSAAIRQLRQRARHQPRPFRQPRALGDVAVALHRARRDRRHDSQDRSARRIGVHLPQAIVVPAKTANIKRIVSPEIHPVHNFEDIRSHLASRQKLTQNDPFVISFDLKLPAGRVQSLFLADLETEDGRRVLRMSTPVGALSHLPAEKCLRFNWAQRVGFLAVDDLDGVAYVHLCENRGYGSLTTRELDRVLSELGELADGLESLVSQGEDRM